MNPVYSIGKPPVAKNSPTADIKNITSERITTLLGSDQQEEVKLGKKLIQQFIKYKLGREGYFSSSVSKEDGKKEFQTVLTNSGVVCKLTSEELIIFASNSIVNKGLPRRLRNLLCGLDNQKNPQLLSNKIRREIEDAIEECIWQDVTGKIYEFLCNHEVIDSYYQETFHHSESKNQIITQQDIKCLNNKLWKANYYGPNYMPLVAYNSNSILLYCNRFQLLWRAPLKQFLFNYRPVIFYSHELGKIDQKLIKQYHRNISQLPNSGNNYTESDRDRIDKQILQVKQFSTIIHPAITKNRAVCYIASIPVSVFVDMKDSSESLLERCKETFRLVVKSVIEMGCKNFVINLFNNYDVKLDNSIKSDILDAFLDVYSEMKNIPGVPEIYFVDNNSKSGFFDNISQSENNNISGSTFRDIILKAGINIIEDQLANHYINDNATTAEKWFIFNPSNSIQNGGYFIQKDYMGIEEEIFRTLLVIPYDVIYNVNSDIIDCINIGMDYNPINLYLQDFITKGEFTIYDFERAVSYIVYLSKKMKDTPYNSFINLETTISLLIYLRSFVLDKNNISFAINEENYEKFNMINNMLNSLILYMQGKSSNFTTQMHQLIPSTTLSNTYQNVTNSTINSHTMVSQRFSYSESKDGQTFTEVNGSFAITKKRIMEKSKICCTNVEYRIIGFLFGRRQAIDIQLIKVSTETLEKMIDELGNLILIYFKKIDSKFKNKLLADILTKNIQKNPMHDQIFLKFLKMTFANFLIYINSPIEDQVKVIAVSPSSSRSKNEFRYDEIGYQNTLEHERQDIKLVHDNSKVLVKQVYETCYIKSLFLVKGYNTNSSVNSNLLIIDDTHKDTIGINHNCVVFNFSNKLLQEEMYKIEIHTAGSYRELNNHTKKDAGNLLDLIFAYNKTVIDVRFLKSFGHDQTIYKNHQKVMAEACYVKNIVHSSLWLNSCAKGTEIFAELNDVTEHPLPAILDICANFDPNTLTNKNLRYCIKDAQKLLLKLFNNNGFNNLGSSRSIFALIIIIISVMPKEQRPILMCGCMSAKDRTMSFIFCALIISTIFFHRVFKHDDKFMESQDNYLSFIGEDGRLVKGKLDEEELLLIKAQINNPILYNILSKLGIGEYNNKNLDIITGFLAEYPELLKLMIAKPLIITGA
ncbi:MAG: hypothetical protein ACK5Z5_08225 [Neisseriaceae bacterium]